MARLHDERLARSVKPFFARGGSRVPRCAACRLPHSHCLCELQPRVASRSGVCLLMGDIEALKPSNTGWLVAEVVPDTFAFAWSRTSVVPALPALLADPQWQPYLVFPGEYAPSERVVQTVAPEADKRPLFVLLDGTWSEARKMFHKSPYLDRLPVLSLQPEQLSNYRLRRSKRDDHLCTSEVASLCLDMAGDTAASETLSAYLDVFTLHYLSAKQQQPPNPNDPAYQRWHSLSTVDHATAPTCPSF